RRRDLRPGVAGRIFGPSILLPMTGHQLSEATQEYLESIYWLYESGIERTQANLARALQVSQPSASEMLKRMSDDGLVSRDQSKLIHFTDRGRELAERIVARHRLVEAYLVKVMGIPWDDV